ncbi:MAG: KilA-N domain-containing protein [Chitinophagaceae bacterium]
MAKNKVIVVKEMPINIIDINSQDYISLTDMVKSFGGDSILYNWIRNRNSIEFMGIWEQIHNPGFNSAEFDRFKNKAGLNSFYLSPKTWINTTNAMGIIARSGRYGGGTYAHKDIAFEFGSWLSAEFKLYLIKEFQRLKDEESKSTQSDWSIQRMLSKINYRIHSDAIREILVPPTITRSQASKIFASEADLLNMAVFGKTATEWKKRRPANKGSLRDEATLEQLVVLTNLECINAVFLRQELSAAERLIRLNQIAISQIKLLVGDQTIQKLKESSKKSLPDRK